MFFSILEIFYLIFFNSPALLGCLFLGCIVTPWPADGNVTCPDSPVNRGKFFVNSGNRCQLGKALDQLKI